MPTLRTLDKQRWAMPTLLPPLRHASARWKRPESQTGPNQRGAAPSPALGESEGRGGSRDLPGEAAAQSVFTCQRAEESWQLLAISHQPSAVSYQPSSISC